MAGTNGKRIRFAAALLACMAAGLLCSCADNADGPAATSAVVASVLISASPPPSATPESQTPATREPSASEPASAFLDQAVCIKKANIYEAQSGDSKVTGTLAAGDTADVLLYGDIWVQVSHLGTTGYVRRENVIRSSAPAVSVPDGAWDSILVNQTHLLPEGFSVSVADFAGGQVDARILEVCQSMFADAKKDGATFKLVDAYRSRELQSELYEAKVQSYIAKGYSRAEAEKEAATITARPDTSEHQTGLALDIVTPSYTSRDKGFAQTRAFAWLHVNAQNYGFTLRYGQDKESITGVIYEPWHWRFVGTDAAKAMKQSGQCLEEFLGEAG